MEVWRTPRHHAGMGRAVHPARPRNAIPAGGQHPCGGGWRPILLPGRRPRRSLVMIALGRSDERSIREESETGIRGTMGRTVPAAPSPSDLPLSGRSGATHGECARPLPECMWLPASRHQGGGFSLLVGQVRPTSAGWFRANLPAIVPPRAHPRVSIVGRQTAGEPWPGPYSAARVAKVGRLAMTSLRNRPV